MAWLGLAAVLLAGSCSGPGEQAAADPGGAAAGAAPTEPAPAGSPAPSAPGLSSLDPPAAGGALAPRLSRHAADLFLTWLEPLSGDASGHSLKFSRVAGNTAGKTWSAPVEIARGSSFFANWADNPGVQRDTDGALVAWWLVKSGPATYAYDIHLAHSADNGASWTAGGKLNRDGVSGEHGFVSAVIEEGGVRAFWLDGREMTRGHDAGHEGSGDMTLRTAVIGTDLMGDEMLDERVCECCGTAAALAATGPVVVYRDRSAEEIRDIWITRRTPTGWSEPRPVHEDGWKVPGCPVNGPAVAARPGEPDQLAVAWFTAAQGRARVQVAFSGDGGKTFTPPVVVDDASPLGRVDLTWDGSGAALVLWLAPHENAGEGKIMLRRVPPNGQPGATMPVAVTSTTRASGFPRMARLENELFLVWTDAREKTTRLRGARLALAGLFSQGAHSAATASPGTAEPATSPTPWDAPRAWDGKPGSRAPAYMATGLDGSQVALADLRGRPLLLNFWATWCLPCRQETPALAALHEQYAPDGLQVVGVSVDAAGEENRVRRFIQEEGVNYTTLMDPADNASRTFGLPMLPVSFLFDGRGVLVWSRFGIVTRNDPELTAVMTQLLAPAPAGH
jgi:peroxiredoxin